MTGVEAEDDRLTAGIVFLLLGLLVLAGAVWTGLSPATAEGHSCGSAWIRKDKALDCYQYYNWSMVVSVAALLVGLALVGVGVAFLRRRRTGGVLTESKSSP